VSQPTRRPGAPYALDKEAQVSRRGEVPAKLAAGAAPPYVASRNVSSISSNASGQERDMSASICSTSPSVSETPDGFCGEANMTSRVRDDSRAPNASRSTR